MVTTTGGRLPAPSASTIPSGISMPALLPSPWMVVVNFMSPVCLRLGRKVQRHELSTRLALEDLPLGRHLYTNTMGYFPFPSPPMVCHARIRSVSSNQLRRAPDPSPPADLGLTRRGVSRPLPVATGGGPSAPRQG